MPRNSQHDSPTKNRFIGAVQAGQTISQAAHENSISQQAGSDLWRTFQETRSTTNHHQSGHPKKLTSRTVSEVVCDSKKNRQKTLADIGNSMTPKLSASSVRRALASNRHHQRKACKVVFINKDQKRARKHWATDYQAFGDEDWA